MFQCKCRTVDKCDGVSVPVPSGRSAGISDAAALQALWDALTVWQCVTAGPLHKSQPYQNGNHNMSTNTGSEYKTDTRMRGIVQQRSSASTQNIRNKISKIELH